MAVCKFCNKTITWLKAGRKFTPLEQDGTLHRCEEMKNYRKVKKIEPSELDPELIKQYEDAINKKK